MAADVIPDHSLLGRMARGDSEAATELRRRHDGSLYALAYGLVLDSAAADAIVAGTFVYATCEAARFDPSSRSVFGWLAAVTKRRAYQLLDASPPPLGEKVDARPQRRNRELQHIHLPPPGGLGGGYVESPRFPGSAQARREFGAA